MKVMTDIETGLDFLFMQFDHNIMERVYITAAAREKFLLMEVNLCEEYLCTLPSVTQLLSDLIYPENPEHEIIGFVSYPKHLANTFFKAVSTAVVTGQDSMSLLEFLRLFIEVADVSHLLTIEQEQDGWVLTGLAEFERQYHKGIRVRIPEAA
ncbi:hypothetical protein P9272_19810 [Mesorhizobium sp. WSM4976]|uniref:hypothetical protein n=1 Tax=Mesorhizobium sp. WSM4976 TaxID=3038549 RepID=UPI002417B895|nr:hypothetical protein [Mesorhizobium sp. WSM4976]MDG4895819.1 hypothetical protein [Mesorhizobium sp. WSM4976]